MKKIIVFIIVAFIVCSDVVFASAAISTNPSAETYYLDKQYDTWNDYVSDMYIDFGEIHQTMRGIEAAMDVVAYPTTNVEIASEIEEQYDGDLMDFAAHIAFYEPREPIVKMWALVQFIRYDTVTDRSTYVQKAVHINKDVLSYLMLDSRFIPEDEENYVAETKLISEAIDEFNKYGLNMLEEIIRTGEENGFSKYENGTEVIYKTKVVGLYGYLENEQVKSKCTYKVVGGDQYLCEQSELLQVIGEQGRLSIKNFEENVKSVTSEFVDEVSDGVSGLMTMFTDMISAVGSVPLLIDSLLGFIPLSLRTVMYSLLGLALTIAIIKIIT